MPSVSGNCVTRASSAIARTNAGLSAPVISSPAECGQQDTEARAEGQSTQEGKQMCHGDSIRGGRISMVDGGRRIGFAHPCAVQGPGTVKQRPIVPMHHVDWVVGNMAPVQQVGIGAGEP